MEKKKKKAKKLSDKQLTWCLVLVFILGLGIMLYPTLSDYWNSLHQTQVIANYDTVVEELDETDSEKMLEEAREYNQKLAENKELFYRPDAIENYAEILNFGDEMMGYITIHKIGVQLPVYHSADEKYMQVGVGHLPGTSFPIGGESTHAVLTGHRGLPSAELFSHLDQMQKGDIFSVSVLGDSVYYVVDDIETVLPDEVDSLQIVDGEDRCTLVTCTPYGVNTHRLLIHGTRTDYVPEEVTVEVKEEGYRVDLMRWIPVLALVVLFAGLGLLYWVLGLRRKKKTSKKESEKTED